MKKILKPRHIGKKNYNERFWWGLMTPTVKEFMHGFLKQVAANGGEVFMQVEEDGKKSAYLVSVMKGRTLDSGSPRTN